MPENPLYIPPVHPCKRHLLAAGCSAGRELAPVATRRDGNGIGREPKCLDDIPGNPDGDIGYTWFHLMKKR